MNALTDFILKYKKTVKYDDLILFTCLVVLGIHFYPTAGRFLDLDEEYYFYITAAISRGMGIYAGLNSYHPPVLWYICSIFFKLSSSLYAAMLSIRILIISLSMVSFYLIFDMFKKIKLSWFIIPTTFFILTSTQFNLKLMEYRADNALLFILILQGYLIFTLSRRAGPSAVKIALIILLGILSFHVNHKALYIEPLILFAFTIVHFKELKNLTRQHAKKLIVLSLMGAALIAFSASYQRFFYQTYIYPLSFAKDAYHTFDDYSINSNGPMFIISFFKYNAAFWLVGIAAFFGFLSHLKKDNKLLLPLMFLTGSALLVLTAHFPFIHYQVYCAWAVLFSLPYLIDLCCKILPEKKPLIFMTFLILALTGTLTFKSFSFPLQPLKVYAAEIDRIREVIGQNSIASFGGASIDIPSDLPLSALDLQFKYDREYSQSGNIGNALIKKATQFIFLDQRMHIKDLLVGEDGYFIRSNYQKCPDLPLMIAAKWIYIDQNTKDLQVEINADYRFLIFGRPVMLNNQPLRPGQILRLAAGKHSVKATGPAVLLIEYASDKTSSTDYALLQTGEYSFIPANRNFEDKFKLQGILKSRRGDQLYFRFFWQALSDNALDLAVFHHFIGADGRYLNEIYLDPADGWSAITDIKKGQTVSYSFAVNDDQKFQSLRAGWYYKENWREWLSCGKEKFFSIRLK